MNVSSAAPICIPPSAGAVVARESLYWATEDRERVPLRAGGASINPRLDELTQPLLRSRNGRAPKSRIPGPGNKVILGNVLMEQRQVASAISAGVLEL